MNCVSNNRRIRLVVSDIDGTALKSGNALAPELKSEIVRLSNCGIGFTFATGRLPYEMEMMFESIPWTVPYAAANGAIIKDQNGYIERKTFCPKHLRPLAEKYSSMGVTIIFTVNDEEHPLYETDWSRNNIGLFPGLDTCVSDSVWESEIERMFFYHPQGKYLQSCKAELDVLSGEYSICFQNYKSIQISAQNCTKGTGVQKISKLTGIPLDEILCIGDSDNDVDMFRVAGICATVTNGTAEVKELADYISPRTYGEGLTEILKQIHPDNAC